MSFANQLQSPIVELLKVVRSVKKIIPLETQPLNITLNRVDVLLTLLARIGIVETKIAFTTIIPSQAKIQANALGMPNVQIPVGLRRKTGLNRLTLQRLLVCKVLFDFDLNKVFVVMRLWVFRWMGHDA